MKSIGIRIGLTILGVALTLAWWTLRDKIRGDSGGVHEASKIPSKVFEGGGNTAVFDVDVTGRSRVSTTFYRYSKTGGPMDEVVATEIVDAGHHSWTIDLAPKTSGEFEATVEDAQPGAKASLSVKLNGKEVVNVADELNEPLKSGYAFGLQERIDEYVDMGEPAKDKDE